MSLLSFIFNLDCGGLPRTERELEELDEDAPGSGRWERLPETTGVCNTCGRSFHAVHINCFCPARCGGKIYAR